MSEEREELIKLGKQTLHNILNEHWCDEFEYGESCKHCLFEIDVCEPLMKALYPELAVREEP